MAQKNNSKKNQKQNRKRKQRAEKIRRQAHAERVRVQPDVTEVVDYALERIDDGDLREGAKIIEKLKTKHRNHAYVIFAMGVLAVKQEDMDKAIGHFAKAVKLDPAFVEAHYNLGTAYQTKFMVPEFVAAFRKVLEIGQPDDEVVDRARQTLDRVEKNIRTSDGVDLDTYVHGHQLFEHGVVHMYDENWEAAIAAFEAVNDVLPHHAQSHGNLGLCHAKLGKRKAALEAYDKALEIDPQYEPALVNRAVARILDEGQPLAGKINVVDFYKDYTMNNRSYIKEFATVHNLLPDKT